MTAAEWRAIPGYPGYEASDDGRIRSINRILVDSLGRVRRLNGRQLKQFVDGEGYRRIGLDRPLLVHRLVCFAFHGDPPAGAWQAAHRDGNCENNCPNNLYWATPSENQLDRVRHGRNHNANKTHCPRGHQYVEGNIVATDGSHRRCKACQRERSAAWRKANLLKARAMSLASYHRRKAAG